MIPVIVEHHEAAGSTKARDVKPGVVCIDPSGRVVLALGGLPGQDDDKVGLFDFKAGVAYLVQAPYKVTPLHSKLLTSYTPFSQ